MVTVDRGCDFDSVCILWSGGTVFSRVSQKLMNVGGFLSDRNVDASLYVAFSNSFYSLVMALKKSFQLSM